MKELFKILIDEYIGYIKFIDKKISNWKYGNIGVYTLLIILILILPFTCTTSTTTINIVKSDGVIATGKIDEEYASTVFEKAKQENDDAGLGYVTSMPEGWTVKTNGKVYVWVRKTALLDITKIHMKKLLKLL